MRFFRKSAIENYLVIIFVVIILVMSTITLLLDQFYGNIVTQYDEFSQTTTMMNHLPHRIEDLFLSLRSYSSEPNPSLKEEIDRQVEAIDSDLDFLLANTHPDHTDSLHTLSIINKMLQPMKADTTSIIDSIDGHLIDEQTVSRLLNISDTAQATQSAVDEYIAAELKYSADSSAELRTTSEELRFASRIVLSISAVFSLLLGIFISLRLREILKELRSVNEELKEAYLTLTETQEHVVHQNKLSVIGELSAGVAQEINEPLGNISSNNAVFERYIEEFSGVMDKYNRLLVSAKKYIFIPEVTKRIAEVDAAITATNPEEVLAKSQSMIQSTKDGVEKVSTLVRSLKDFADTESIEDFSDLNLNYTIDKVLLIIKPEIDDTIYIKKTYGDLPLIKSNIGLMAQVMLNIIRNALQAINKNNGTPIGRIDIHTYTDSNHVVCEIMDNGCGLDEKILPKIYDPFFTTNRNGNNTGLGLSIAYDIIVNKHGGELFAKTTTDGLTCFTMKFPVFTAK